MRPKPDLIAAIATAPGRGGIGVVRISGDALNALARGILGRLPAPRIATHASFLDAEGGVLDQGIALYFSAPHSYTGEDVLELQGHGGMAVLQLVLQRCLELGARLAQPGEFTLRAYLNGKLDLAQAESVADLIDAATGQAARSAIRSLQGDFSRAVHGVVDGLIQLRVWVEASLDFPEEGLTLPPYEATLARLREQLETLLRQARQGSLLRAGAQIVLAGQPNVGKSSLINRLSGEDLALVSEIPGTTRDAIRQTLQIEGLPLHIVDTAGLRESQDVVEQMGVARARSMLQEADAILVLMDARQGITAPDQKILDELPSGVPHLRLFNKTDLLDQPARKEEQGGEKAIYLSAKTGAGLDLLRHELLSLIGWTQEASVFMARERHIRALLLAQNHLRHATAEVARPEVFAEELRLAQDALNTITGEFAPDDLLGEIFGRFCIGK